MDWRINALQMKRCIFFPHEFGQADHRFKWMENSVLYQNLKPITKANADAHRSLKITFKQFLGNNCMD